MKLVELDEDAEAELNDTVAWYEEREAGVGRRFFEHVEARVDAIPELKLKPLRGFESRGALFVEVGSPWPFRIIIVERPTFFRVVAIAHDRRASGYWLPRLKR